jgi:hypothetical protein
MINRTFGPMNNGLEQDRSTSSTRAVPFADSPVESEGIWESVTQFVHRRPAACLAAAVISGVILGWWIKRR